MSMFADVLKQRAKTVADLATESLSNDDVTVGAPVVPADGGEPVVPTPADATPDPMVDAPADGTPVMPVAEDAAQAEEAAAAKTDPNDMADTTLTGDQAGAATSAALSTLRVRKMPAMTQIAQLYQGFGRTQQAATALVAEMKDLETVTVLKNVVSAQPLSQPLVIAFESLPGFDQLVPNFPSSDQFNIIPEAKTSAKLQLGLESLGLGEVAALESVGTRAQDVAAAFGAALEALGATVVILKDQLVQDLANLAASDLTEEVLADLPVTLVNQADLVELLTKLDNHAKVMPFSADELRAHPEGLRDEVTALAEVIADGMVVLGLTLDDAKGLVQTAKNARFVASAGTFGEKAVTIADLTALLGQGVTLCDTLLEVAEQKDALSAALESETVTLPTAMSSDDVTYGVSDHVALVQCYAVHATTALQESLNAVAMVQSAVDAALNIDGGTTV